MKAIRFHSFGGPDTLQLDQVILPRPGPKEVLIRVHAAAINPVDLKIRAGQFKRYQPSFPAIPGRDVSGAIEQVGSGVTQWQTGQEVMGMLNYEHGTYAEYTVASADEIIAKPATLDHAPVYRDWVLPPAFADLRRELESRLGVRTGVRHFIRVLQLLARHPLDRVERAIHPVRIRGDPDATRITAQADRLARQPSPEPTDTTMSLTPSPLPDLSRFNRLLRSHPTPEEEADE